jgi:ClpP class serine protease
MIRSDLHYALKAGRPLLIDPIKAQAFLKNAELIVSNPEIAYQLSAFMSPKTKEDIGPKAKRFRAAPVTDEDEEDLEAVAARGGLAVNSSPYVKDGTGIIPVRGVIGKCLSALEAMLGCADIDRIAQQLDTWQKDDTVFEVVLHMDSGGGSTTGLEELAKKIRTYDKPTIAFTDSDCGSAAYWMASQCKRFVTTPSASVGAVGVYITMTDERKKFEKEGREVVVIKSGKYKAAGVEGTSLTTDQINSLQDEVDELHGRFIRDVRSVRQFAQLEDLQGQSFYGDKAAQRGLTTGIVDSLSALLEEIKNTRKAAHRAMLPSMYSQPMTPTSIEGVNPYSG